MIAWALHVGRSGRGRTAHAFDTAERKRSGVRALCGKWAKHTELDMKPPDDAKCCKECWRINLDTGKFSKWGAGR